MVFGVTVSVLVTSCCDRVDDPLVELELVLLEPVVLLLMEPGQAK